MVNLDIGVSITQETRTSLSGGSSLLQCKGKSKYIVISLNNRCNPSFYEIEEVIKNFVLEIKILKKDHKYKVTGKENKNMNYEILMIVDL